MIPSYKQITKALIRLWMCRLVCAFVARKSPKTGFLHKNCVAQKKLSPWIEFVTKCILTELKRAVSSDPCLAIQFHRGFSTPPLIQVKGCCQIGTD